MKPLAFFCGVLSFAVLMGLLLADPPTVSKSVTINNIPDENSPIPIAGTVKASWDVAQGVKLTTGGGNNLAITPTGEAYTIGQLQGWQTVPGSPDQMMPVYTTGKALNVYVINQPIVFPPVPTTVLLTNATSAPGLSSGIEPAGTGFMNYTEIIFSVTGVWVGTIKIDGSNEGGNWFPLACEKSDGSGVVTSTAAPAMLRVHQPPKFVRASWLEYTSGAATINCLSRSK